MGMNDLMESLRQIRIIIVHHADIMEPEYYDFGTIADFLQFHFDPLFDEYLFFKQTYEGELLNVTQRWSMKRV